MGAECLCSAPWRSGLSCGLCTHALKDRHLQIIHDGTHAMQCACTHTHTHTQRVKFLHSAVRSGSDSADGKTMNIFIIQNSRGAPGLSSRASPYQPAGNPDATNVLPSWPFWALQGACRVQRIESTHCCNPPNLEFIFTTPINVSDLQDLKRDYSSCRTKSLIVVKITTLQGY